MTDLINLSLVLNTSSLTQFCLPLSEVPGSSLGTALFNMDATVSQVAI